MARVTREAGVQATGVIGAVDIALWDLVGKAAGLPCWQLLGGYRDWVPAYADVPTRATSPQELGQQLAACVEMGFDAVKFHILNRDPEDIVRQTAAAREAIGPRGPADDRPLRLDRRAHRDRDLPADRAPRPLLGRGAGAARRRAPRAGRGGPAHAHPGGRGGRTALALRGAGHPGGGRTELPADRHRRRRGLHQLPQDGRPGRGLPRASGPPRGLAAGPARPPGGGPPPHRHHPGHHARPASGDLHPAVAGLRRGAGARPAERAARASASSSTKGTCAVTG